MTDGAGFGAEGFVRISYATSMEQIEEGVARIKRFTEKIRILHKTIHGFLCPIRFMEFS